MIESPKFEHQKILLYIRIHTKRLTQWHPKVIPSGVKRVLSGQSLHPTYHYVLYGPPLLLLTNFDPHNNHSTPSRALVVIVHRFPLFYLTTRHICMCCSKWYDVISCCPTYIWEIGSNRCQSMQMHCSCFPLLGAQPQYLLILHSWEECGLKLEVNFGLVKVKKKSVCTFV